MARPKARELSAIEKGIFRILQPTKPEHALRDWEDWASTDLPRDASAIAKIYDRVTLSKQECLRRNNPYEALRLLATSWDGKCGLHLAVLVASCAVIRSADTSGKGLPHFRSIQESVNANDNQWAALRRSTLRCIKFIDALHQQGRLHRRTYEFLLFRNGLRKFEALTMEHILYLQTNQHILFNENFTPPPELIDSTFLRIPNLVYDFFVGRYSRETIERLIEWPGNQANDICHSSFSQSWLEEYKKPKKPCAFLYPMRLPDTYLNAKAKMLDMSGSTYDNPAPDMYNDICSFVSLEKDVIKFVLGSYGLRPLGPNSNTSSEELLAKAEIFGIEPGSWLAASGDDFFIAILLSLQPLSCRLSSHDFQWEAEDILCFFSQKGIRPLSDRMDVLLFRYEVKAIGDP